MANKQRRCKRVRKRKSVIYKRGYARGYRKGKQSRGC